VKLVRIILSLIAFGVLISVIGGTAFAQSDPSCPSCVHIPYDEIDLYKELFPLIIWTDSHIHNHDSKITVHGFLRPENAVAPVTITVTNPIGNIVAIEQIPPSSDGNFSFTLNTSGPTMTKDGDYVIKAKSGADSRVFKTKVTLVSYDLGEVNACSESEIVVAANNGGVYCIPFKVNKGQTTGVEGKLDVTTKTLSLNIRAQDIESMVLDIPRYILDSKSSDGSDSKFVVMSFDKMIPYAELEGDSFTRKVKIDYSPVRNGQIDIMGTHVIPEFGSVAVIILAVSVSSILIFSKTQKIIHM